MTHESTERTHESTEKMLRNKSTTAGQCPNGFPGIAGCSVQPWALIINRGHTPDAKAVWNHMAKVLGWVDATLMLSFFFFSHSRLNYLVMHYFSTQISFEQSCCPIFLWFPFKAVDSLIQMSPKVLVEEKDSMKPFAKGKYSGRKEPVRQSDLVFKKKLGLVIWSRLSWWSSKTFNDLVSSDQ